MQMEVDLQREPNIIGNIEEMSLGQESDGEDNIVNTSDPVGDVFSKTKSRTRKQAKASGISIN